MYNVYYNNGVESGILMYSTSVKEDAIEWAEREIKDKVKVDNEHSCSEEMFQTSRIAYLEVYDGEFADFDEDDVEFENPKFNDPIYQTSYYYDED